MEALRTIPSKETVYAGVRFKSRLEASWARHFHAQGLSYEYEPETFCLDMGRLFYTPDFYLPGEAVYVEIKPVFDGAFTKDHGLILNYYEEALEKCLYLERMVRPCVVDIYLGKPGTSFKFRFEKDEIVMIKQLGYGVSTYSLCFDESVEPSD